MAPNNNSAKRPHWHLRNSNGLTQFDTYRGWYFCLIHVYKPFCREVTKAPLWWHHNLVFLAPRSWLLGVCFCTKGGFFQKVQWNFFRSPDLKKRIFQKTILSLKIKFTANNTSLLKFMLRIVFWNDFFFEIWRSEKISSHFLKKSHL